MGLRKVIADGIAGIVGLAILLVGGNFMLHAPAPTAASGSSIWDRALSPEVLEVLRLGLIVVGAFVAAALVQRTILGKFGFKAGPVELAELGDIGPVVEPGIRKVAEDFKGELEALAADANTRFARVDQVLEAIAPLLQLQESRIRELEQKE